MVLVEPSNRQSWLEGEHELGILTFEIAAQLDPCLLDVQIAVLDVKRDGVAALFSPIDAVVFVGQVDPYLPE